MLPHDSHSLNQSKTHLSGLDGLRGAAALLVFLSHSSASNQHLLGLDFNGVGKLGVTIFFVLSAHLLTRQFIGSSNSDKWNIPAIKKYFFRRFIRIYPLYFVYLSLALFTTWASVSILGLKHADGVPLTMDLSSWIKHLALIRGEGVTWSIAVEFKYYFILPILTWLFYLARRKGPLYQFVISVGAITAASVLWPPSNLQKCDTRLTAYLAIFLTGSFSAWLAMVWDKIPDWKNHVLRILVILSPPFIAATTPPLVRNLRWIDGASYLPDHWMLAHGIAAVPILFAAAYQNGFTNRIFRSRFLRFVGMISFSLYLWHPVFIQGGARLMKGWDPLLIGWFALGGTLLASYLSYMIIERPFLKFGIKRDPVHK